MQLTRRNTIIGLGTIAAGAGVISGSGAFDSVEANRSFEVSVSGDAGALLGLEATNSTIAGTETGGAGDNDIIFFRINDSEAGGDAAINENAVTEFFNAFTVTNNGAQDVNLSIELPDSDWAKGLSFIIEHEDDDDPTDITNESYELEPGDARDVDLRINTRTVEDGGGYVEPGENEDPYQITILAQTSAAQQA